MRFRKLSTAIFLACASWAFAQNTNALYTKYEYMAPMRDGVKLYVSVYVPKGKPGKHPVLLERTPYGAGPYGADTYKGGFRGSPKMKEAGYIFAFSDVRGKGMSEGNFENVRPQLRKTYGQDGWKAMPHDIDESTDTYDTIDYLVKNIPDNNGNFGLWGISYPGGYAAQGAMSGHPALKAASPQAPTADWFLGDDMHHNGAFMLQDYLSFFSGFGAVRPAPGQSGPAARFNIGDDAYKFFLDLGGLSNVDSKLYQGKIPYWYDVVRHDTYDEFWQNRSIPSSLVDIKCAMLWVGGFFDAEDCWGAINCYKAAEAKSPGQFNSMVMGPWYHGMWAGGTGRTFHVFDWANDTSTYFQNELEFPFFDHYLRGTSLKSFPEAVVFDSGAKRWANYSKWPPTEAKTMSFYLAAGKTLNLSPGPSGSDAYVSDPAKPVPYQGGVLKGRSRTYMLDDQTFASQRADVLTYQTTVLDKPITLAGDLSAELFVQVGGTDCDFVVKLIDVFPATGTNANMQMLVRGEVMRSKFRNSFSNPSPLDPNKVERVGFTLPGTMHTFLPGHRLMVQVQSSWFPLVDRNPHKFMNIFTAKDNDFVSATVKVMYGGTQASRLIVQTVPTGSGTAPSLQ